jgi:predicted RNA-binding protein
MCQISVYVENEGVEALLLEDVTSLSVETTGVKVSTLFDGPREVADAVIDSIDFMAGKVLLKKTA